MGKTGIRWLARVVAATCLASGVAGTVAAAAHASDDYPWAGRGQCPIVPQVPIEEPEPVPVTPTPGQQPGDEPGDAAPVVEPPPPPPPVLDPVSGHLYDPRGPRPTCASRVWSIDGSIGDPWGFVWRNCTSFVSWRLHERNGMDRFGNHFRGEHWGNADNWDDVARRLGYRVDSVPAIGAVAQTDAGRVGHVAWVSAVGPGTVTIEEYNHALPGGYGTRTVPATEFRYLHLDDVAPSPYVGSDRTVVAAPDTLGGSWTARVDDRGTLWLARPGRPARTVGPRRAFSPVAAPALMLSRRGLPWLAATTREGRVLAGTPRRGRLVLRRVARSASTASPAVALTSSGRPLLAAVSPDGTLVTRRLTLHGGWSRPARVGRPASWGTHTAPVLGADAQGRSWLVAVTEGGATFAQSLGRGRLQRLGGPSASVTSTPALSTDGTGTTRLHQVTATGRLGVRTLDGGRWSRPAWLAGRWSPYASPAVDDVAGQLHVAATGSRGAVVVRSAVPGTPSHLGRGARPGRDLTLSPGLLTRRDGGVFVVARTGARLLARPAAAAVDDSLPTSAGFTP
ncbi:CHAP domain-containing protein [Nocardioides eburneiflavus]|uniref:CHAP domain-containing protein n=1 Tax=Nocardioides eburneiflavus TaxID=2518372 RepID=UPI00143D13B9|nr:CHAP domain-containing protein [Nocardioides eburneiflavus]